MRRLQRDTFNRWLIITGLFAFGLFILWDQKLLGTMIRDDQSKLSLIILLSVIATSAYLGHYARRLDQHHKTANDSGDKLTERSLKGPLDNGWFIADAMIKLGLIGTVIGFILMLSSVPHTQDIDVATIQAMLETMTEGMRVALYTTVAGIGGGLIISLQCQILERASDELLNDHQGD